MGKGCSLSSLLLPFIGMISVLFTDAEKKQLSYFSQIKNKQTEMRANLSKK